MHVCMYVSAAAKKTDRKAQRIDIFLIKKNTRDTHLDLEEVLLPGPHRIQRARHHRRRVGMPLIVWCVRAWRLWWSDPVPPPTWGGHRIDPDARTSNSRMQYGLDEPEEKKPPPVAAGSLRAATIRTISVPTLVSPGV